METSGSRLDDDLLLAHWLADLTESAAMPFFDHGVKASLKADGTPVTAADLEVERELVEALAVYRPNDGITSEEGSRRAGSGRSWILDPIDGTVNFAAGDPNWGSHIALQVEGDVVLGIITRPVIGMRWWARRGEGAFRGTSRNDADAVRLQVSSIDSLSRARVTLWPVEGSPYLGDLQAAGAWVDSDWTALERLLDGRLDAIIACAGGPWDHAPAVVLTEEAGGRFRDPDGGRRLDLSGAVYTNGLIDEQLDALIQRQNRAGHAPA